MMDRKKILDEGLLEKYLLDELNTSDRSLVEHAIKNDKEVKKKFSELEEDFEKMAFENAIIPPSTVKAELKTKLEETKVRQLSYRPLLVAASISVLFLASSIWMYTEWQKTQKEFEVLQNQTTDLKERLNSLEENYVLTNTRLKTIDGQNIIPLLLKGNELSPNSRAIAYINHEKKIVVVNSEGLPKLPEDKTYQMWSDVNGEMINMGVLKTSERLITLKYIDKAESLNITIEPEGGNDHPTVENLISYVTL